jgi:DNA-directed RNA polymerase subunit RPC12/RpoP
MAKGWMGAAGVADRWRAPKPMREPPENERVTVRCWQCLAVFESWTASRVQCPRCGTQPYVPPKHEMGGPALEVR